MIGLCRLQHALMSSLFCHVTTAHFQTCCDVLTVLSSDYRTLSDRTEFGVAPVVNEQFCLGSAFWPKRMSEPKHAAVWTCCSVYCLDTQHVAAAGMQKHRCMPGLLSYHSKAICSAGTIIPCIIVAYHLGAVTKQKYFQWSWLLAPVSLRSMA